MEEGHASSNSLNGWGFFMPDKKWSPDDWTKHYEEDVSDGPAPWERRKDDEGWPW